MTRARQGLLNAGAAIGCAVVAATPIMWLRFFPNWLPSIVAATVGMVFTVAGIIAWAVFTQKAYNRNGAGVAAIAFVGSPFVLFAALFLGVMGIAVYFDLSKTS